MPLIQGSSKLDDGIGSERSHKGEDLMTGKSKDIELMDKVFFNEPEKLQP